MNILFECLTGDAGGNVHVHNISRDCTEFMLNKNAV